MFIFLCVSICNDFLIINIDLTSQIPYQAVGKSTQEQLKVSLSLFATDCN